MDYTKLFSKIDNVNYFLVVSKTNLRNIIKIKSKLEQANNKLFKFKVISSEELIDLLTFSLNDELYLQALDDGIPLSIIKEMIKFSKYDLNNKNDKLNSFKTTYQKYLIKHPDFLKNLGSFKFFILDNILYLKPLFDYYQLNYEMINLDYKKIPKVKTFKLVEEEIIYLFEEISKLLKGGTLLSEIYIANLGESYYGPLNKVSKLYQIPIPSLNKTKLSELHYINELLSLDFSDLINLLKDTDLLNETYKAIRIVDKTSFDNNINKLINIINKYPHSYNSLNLKIVINDSLAKINAYEPLNTNTINIVNNDELLTVNDGYIFILNGSYESFPKLEKDNNYLTDLDKKIINYPTSEDVNSSNNDYLNKLIKNDSVEYISYSKNDYYNEFTPSDLLVNLKMSKELTSLELKQIDLLYSKPLIKNYFKDENSNGSLLTTFDGSFNVSEYERLEISKVLKSSNIKLSPSAITRYYQVPFIYYLERILRLTSYVPSVSQMIGDFFHLLSEVSFELNFEEKIKRSKPYSNDVSINKLVINLIVKHSTLNDLELLYDDFLEIYISEILKEQDHLLKVKTNFFLIKVKEQLMTAVKYLIENENVELSDEIHLEKKVSNNLVSGNSDLVKYKKDEFIIVDYKSKKKTAFHFEKITETIEKLLSNSKTANLDNLDLIQVVIYAYLLNLDNKNYRFNQIGFFGYFEENFTLNTLYKEYTHNFYIKNATRQITVEEEDSLYELSERLISKTIDNILAVNFPVKVLKTDGKTASLDKTWFSVYQALAFFYNPLESEEEIDDE